MGTKPMSDEQVREAVRERYAASARSVLAAEPQAGCCGADRCCGGAAIDPVSSDLYDASNRRRRWRWRRRWGAAIRPPWPR